MLLLLENNGKRHIIAHCRTLKLPQDILFKMHWSWVKKENNNYNNKKKTCERHLHNTHIPVALLFACARNSQLPVKASAGRKADELTLGMLCMRACVCVCVLKAARDHINLFHRHHEKKKRSTHGFGRAHCSSVGLHLNGAHVS